MPAETGFCRFAEPLINWESLSKDLIIFPATQDVFDELYQGNIQTGGNR